ncbi:hypothetical protein ACTWP5_18810 [Streptomyces sp. 4N509B]|uniref:hypothetical protein n=1 Tax=Streptomyces sp. 4N509B TaxID=3457413 RepID=UPI003FD0181C
MGYTHYFSYAPRTDSFRAAWPQIVNDTRRIVNHIMDLGIPLAGPDGKGSPEVTREGIRFNGKGRDAYEALAIWPHPPSPDDDAWQASQYNKRRFVWYFCKTARHRYDVAVAATLLRCHQLASDAFVIGSDGRWELEWRHGSFSARSVVEDLFATRMDLSPFGRDTVDGPPSVDPI